MTMVSELQPQINFVPAESYLVSDLETLKVLADPLRLRIRELMGKPTTVKQVAAKLDLPATKLYYHINLLEKHGLIVLVDTRVVSGIIEKHYQVAAHNVRVAKHLLSPGTDPAGEGLSLTIGSFFESARNELLQSVKEGIVDWNDEGERHKGLSLQTSIMTLNEQEAAQFYREVESLFERYVELSRQNEEAMAPEDRAFRTLYILFPTKDKAEE
jgi:DNA-binding transcriptional ArsR family regulator